MLKEQLLREFEQNKGKPLSGQFLADKYRVSRNAVWKAVNMLKKEGWPVLTQGRKGYLLDPDADLLSEEGILSCLSGPVPDRILVLAETDSTNSEAMRMLASGFSGSALIVSDLQHKGKGHRQSSFYSPAGSGLYMTLILPITLSPEHMKTVGMGAALAVIRSVEKLTGRHLVIRKTSDICFGEKKLGGILCEAVSPDLEAGIIRNICIGIGLNLTTDSFPEELADSFTSLGGGCSRCSLAAAITDELNRTDFPDPDSFLPEYKRFHAGPV